MLYDFVDWIEEPFDLADLLPLHSSVPEEEVPLDVPAPTLERDIMNRVRVISCREHHVQRFNTTRTEYTIEIDDSDLSFGDFRVLFDILVDWITEGFLPSDHVGIQLTMMGLKKHPVSALFVLGPGNGTVPSRPAGENRPVGDKVRPTCIKIKVIRVQLPNGSGPL